jgi:hypothetical protein
MTTLESTIQIPEDVLFHELAGEAVLLNLETGKYYGLNEIGTRMWMLLNEHRRLEPTFRALLDEFEVGEEQLRADLLKLVDDLAAQGLLVIEQN